VEKWFFRGGVFAFLESNMEITADLIKKVEHLEEEINLIKEDNHFLYDKLEKAYGDRIALRSENYRLKEKVKMNGQNQEKLQQASPEEDCIACSA
tara:strand:+ start:269 stop:553 length:285 start_codon:yes stop_codon:yes gene_type:complete